LGVPLASLGSVLLPVSAFGLGPPATMALRAVVRRHRALSRPPVAPNAKGKYKIAVLAFHPSVAQLRPEDQGRGSGVKPSTLKERRPIATRWMDSLV
jgi:hypothetical protein